MPRPLTATRGASTGPHPPTGHPRPTRGRGLAGGSGPRFTAVLLGAALVVAVALLLSVAVGTETIAPARVWQAVTGDGTGREDIIVRTLRVPRTILALLVGIALGVAGTVMQSVTRNPLAEPGLFGVSAGAALAVVVGMRLRLVETIASSIWWALIGAVLATLIVLALARTAWAQGGSPTISLAVIGVAISAGLSAITSGIVLLDTQTLDGYREWAVGSLAGRGPEVITAITPYVVVGMLLLLPAARGLDALALGEQTAGALGVRVARLRLLGVAGIALLVAAAVAAAGPIAFVGLLVAHSARFLVGGRHAWLLPLSALLGAATLLLADTLGRVLAGDGELQVGVVLGLVGGPCFVALIARRRFAL